MATITNLTLSEQNRKDLDSKYERILAERPLEESCVDFLSQCVDQLPTESEILLSSEVGNSFWLNCYVWTTDVSQDHPKVYCYIHYYPSIEEAANELRGLVQKVLHIPAVRKFNERTGDTQYVFDRTWKVSRENESDITYELNVSIDKGAIARGCTLVQVEKTTMVWETHCEEEAEEIMGA